MVPKLTTASVVWCHNHSNGYMISWVIIPVRTAISIPWNWVAKASGETKIIIVITLLPTLKNPDNIIFYQPRYREEKKRCANLV